MKSSIRIVLAFAAGAAVGACVATLIATRDGHPGSTKPAEARAAGASTPSAREALAPPATNASREELLARDAQQRRRIDELNTQIALLERSPRAGAAPVPSTSPPPPVSSQGATPEADLALQAWIAPSAETLATWAQECKLFYDVPLVLDSEPFQLSAEAAAKHTISDVERDVINATLRELHRRYHALLVQLYVEATGDDTRAEELAPIALAKEIEDKAPRGEDARVRRKLARERAGLDTPPADLSGTSAFERYMRAFVTLAPDSEAMMVKELGAARARELRNLQIWYGTEEMWGCPD